MYLGDLCMKLTQELVSLDSLSLPCDSHTSFKYNTKWICDYEWIFGKGVWLTKPCTSYNICIIRGMHKNIQETNGRTLCWRPVTKSSTMYATSTTYNLLINILVSPVCNKLFVKFKNSSGTGRSIECCHAHKQTSHII